MVEIKHRHIKLSGVELHMVFAGQGKPLVLVHGWPEFRATWRPVIARLAERFLLIAPDLRGFGYSENPHPQPFAGRRTIALLEAPSARSVSTLLDNCSC